MYVSCHRSPSMFHGPTSVSYTHLDVYKRQGCTCFGNPTDGRASANADVAGFRLSALIDEAAPVEGANTITFTSRDGYQVTLPLQYVMQRYSLIVTTVKDVYKRQPQRLQERFLEKFAGSYRVKPFHAVHLAHAQW